MNQNAYAQFNNNLQFNNLKLEDLIAFEVKRLSEKYNKAFLDCDELVEVTGLGRDNVRALMHSRNFPVIKSGNRQIVSILAFVTWQFTHDRKEAIYG